VRQKIVVSGFILKKKTLLNKDVLVTLFTKERGKLVVMAKGVKKITSRRLAYLDTGNLVQITLNSYRENFFYLTEIDLISGFLSIKKKRDKFSDFYRSLYLIDRLLPEGQVETDVYQELKLFLFALAREKAVIDREKLFFCRVFKILGYGDFSFENGDWLAKAEMIINRKLPPRVI